MRIIQNHPSAVPASSGLHAAVVSALAICVGLVGCTAEPAGDSAGSQPADEASAASSATGPAAVSPSTKADRQAWYVTYMLGAKIGYQHTVWRHETRNGQVLSRVDMLSHLVTKRGLSSIATDLRVADVSTADGGLVECQSKVSQGGTSITSRGSVVGDTLRIETTTRGKTVTSTIPWSADWRGFSAVEQSLVRKPMTPGEHRRLRALIPGLDTPLLATVELTAVGPERVKLLTGTYDLLRVDCVTTVPGSPAMRDTYWVDRTGQSMKAYNELVGAESFLTTREVAQDTRGLAQLDFNLDLAAPADRAVAAPHATRRVRYRLTLQRGDPAAAFVSGASQQVTSIDPHTAEVTVYALRPGQAGAKPDASDDAPGEEDRRPSSIIQSDNPKIAALARKVAGDKKDPWQKAVALERFVHGYVALKGFSQGFATAADVVESREGDCTEHAVLLAALCRAAGIPARVAVGLVYQDQKFLFHMWTEVYVGKRWTPIDATLARGGIGAAHLKLAHSSLQGSSAFNAVLSVANVLARGLKVEVLEVE